jgi:hypothetical protein
LPFASSVFSDAERLGGHALHHARGARREQAGEVGARQAVGVNAEGLSRSAVGGFNQKLFCRHDQDRIGDRFEDHLVAAFGLAQARIVALDILLRLDEALLQFRDFPQVPAERDHGAARRCFHSAVGDRHIAHAARRVVHLAGANRRRIVAGAQQGFDFCAAVGGDGVYPGPADPSIGKPAAAQVFRGNGNVFYEAILDDDGDIRGLFDEAGNCLRIKARQMFLRFPERGSRGRRV